MKKHRKIAMVINHVLIEEEDRLDTLFWLSKPPSERLSEVARLRKAFFSDVNRPFPEKLERVVTRRAL